jgi:putative phage-type endonuclease
MENLHKVLQQTPEWFAQRVGKATASRIADIIAKTKTGPSTSRANYLAQLVAERLTGNPAESFSNAAMQHGTETEPLARMAYEVATGRFVTEVDMVPHPRIEMSGASPDGLVGDDGLIEIKCPNTATHIDTLLTKKAPSKYIPQMMWQMACTGRQWCDFVSFDPRMPAKAQLFIVRVERNDDWLKIAEEEVTSFLAEVDAKVTALKSIIGE